MLRQPKRLSRSEELDRYFVDETLQPVRTQLHTGLFGHNVPQDDEGLVFARRDHILNIFDEFPLAGLPDQ